MNKLYTKFKIWDIALAFLLFTLLALPSYLFASPSSGECEVCETQGETGIETGIEYLGSPPEIPFLKMTAGSETELGDLCRYPARLHAWKKMVDEKAYFRDVLVGQVTHIREADDGDSWTCKGILPDGSVIRWPTMYFYSSYGDKENCFVTPWWVACDSRDINVRWYTASQCRPTGTWTFKFDHNDSPIFSDQFKLLPQLPPDSPDCVPLYNQKAYTDAYGGICKSCSIKCKDVFHCDGRLGEVKWTIEEKGCALTSAAMVLTYHGKPTDPSALNTWLINNDGYTSKGNVIWGKVCEYSGGKLFEKPWGGKNDPMLEKDICTYGPQIMHVKGCGHFVVATGRDAAKTTWFINDPNGGVATDLHGYNNTYKGTRRFMGPEYAFVDVYCGITIYFHSPGELLITDPQGRRTGYDPIAGIEYLEIPRSAYVSEAIEDATTGEPGPETKIIDIRQPLQSDYELKVIGTEEGNYTLEIYAHDRENNQSAKEFLEPIPISSGMVHTYTLNYSREAGSKLEVSGSFDGKGQRPRDVNKFLSYSNPTQMSTDVPAGVTTFDLFIFYDKATVPASFKAELNRQDITGLFCPSPGGAEVVRLNLVKGRNTLVLSIDGTLPSGRVATDRDRLVFVLP